MLVKQTIVQTFNHNRTYLVDPGRHLCSPVDTTYFRSDVEILADALPIPLDNCECGHYRSSHNSKTGMGETTCNACTCYKFSLKLPKDERSKVQTRA